MILLLIRGLPGVGKSTAAKGLGDVALAADDWMVDENGQYKHEAARLGYCHGECQAAARAYLLEGRNVVVANTFCQEWEVAPYRQIAKDCGAELKIISLFDGGFSDEQLAARNVHGVSAEAIARMRGRYQHGLE